jgi:hypothetical protein
MPPLNAPRSMNNAVIAPVINVEARGFRGGFGGGADGTAPGRVS